MRIRTSVIVSLAGITLMMAGPDHACSQSAGAQAPAGTADRGAPAKQVNPADQGMILLRQAEEDLQRGDFEEAVERFTKARRLLPGSARAAYGLGLALRKTQNYADAVQHLKDAMTLPPAVPEASLELADTYYALGRNEEALKALGTAERNGIMPAHTAFLRGLILAKQKNYNDAVLSFKMAGKLDRSLEAAADLQIAGTYAEQGKLAEALKEYQDVAKREGESDLGVLASQQGEAIQRRLRGAPAFQLAAGLSYQFDSNVMLKPDTEPVSTSSATVITGESDTAAIATAQAEYAPGLRDPWGLRLQYSFFMSSHGSLKSYDLQSHTAGLTPFYRFGGGTLSLQMSYGDTRVDGEKYLTSISASPIFLFSPWNGNQAWIFVKYLDKDFEQQAVIPEEARNGTTISAGAAWVRLMAEGRGNMTFRYEYDSEDADGQNWDLTGHTLVISAASPLGAKLMISGALTAGVKSYSNVHSVFNKKRSDTTYSLTLQARYPVAEAWDLHIQAAVMKADSNLDVYAYTKQVVEAGVSVRF